MITGYTLFVEDEERSAGAILTRSDMEAHMVVNLAGRCSEKLVMGESEVTGVGGAAGWGNRWLCAVW
jgi:cell division protease FtsH